MNKINKRICWNKIMTNNNSNRKNGNNNKIFNY